MKCFVLKTSLAFPTSVTMRKLVILYGKVSSAEITEIALKFDKSHFLAYVGLDKFQCQGTP